MQEAKALWYLLRLYRSDNDLTVVFQCDVQVVAGCQRRPLDNVLGGERRSYCSICIDDGWIGSLIFNGYQIAKSGALLLPALP